MKIRMLAALLAFGLCTAALAEVKGEYPQIAFVGPSTGKAEIKRDQFILLVIEGLYVAHEKTPIADERLVGFVNDLLKAKGVSYVGVHIREGVKYGDVVRALDRLSQTNAKNIGVSMTELPAGREP